MRLPHRLLTILLSAACAAAVGAAPNEPDSPQTRVPAELVGTWITGTVSATNFYEPSTGSWTNGHGTGLFYRFNADGTFEYGWQEYANSYGSDGAGDADLGLERGPVRAHVPDAPLPEHRVLVVLQELTGPARTEPAIRSDIRTTSSRARESRARTPTPAGPPPAPRCGCACRGSG